MNVSHPKALLISIASGIVVSIAGAILFVLLGEWDFVYALGSMLLIVGLMALALGLLGAVEPPEGWATGRGRNRRQVGRRSILAQVGTQGTGAQETESLSLAAWGIIVGGSHLLLGVLAFSLT
ncbi:MAG: hypothetical protein ACLGHL_02250 [Actinomycetota bacterium]